MRRRPDLLGEFEQIVLLAVLRIGDEAYAIPVRAEIRERARRQVARGALYTALDRLEGKGLLSSRMSEPRPERGGRSRRMYSVTPRGLAALRAARDTMQSLWSGLEKLQRS
jgi:DNA-binding PadR family transcriptional regulator